MAKDSPAELSKWLTVYDGAQIFNPIIAATLTPQTAFKYIDMLAGLGPDFDAATLNDLKTSFVTYKKKSSGRPPMGLGCRIKRI